MSSKIPGVSPLASAEVHSSTREWSAAAFNEPLIWNAKPTALKVTYPEFEGVAARHIKLAAEMSHPRQDNTPPLLPSRVAGIAKSITDTLISSTKMYGVAAYELAPPQQVRASLKNTYATDAVRPALSPIEKNIGAALRTMDHESAQIQQGFGHLLSDPQTVLADYAQGLAEPFLKDASTPQEAFAQGYAGTQIFGLVVAPLYLTAKVGSGVNHIAGKVRQRGALNSATEYVIKNQGADRKVQIYPPGTALPATLQLAAQQIIEVNSKKYGNADVTELAAEIGRKNLVLVSDVQNPNLPPAVAVVAPVGKRGGAHTNDLPAKIFSNPLSAGDYQLSHVVTSPALRGSGGDATRAAFALAHHNRATGVVFENTGHTGAKMLTANQESLLTPHHAFFEGLSGRTTAPYSSQPRQTGVYLPYDGVEQLQAMGMPKIEQHLRNRAAALTQQGGTEAARAQHYLDLIPRIEAVLNSADPHRALNQLSIKDRTLLPLGAPIEYRMNLVKPDSFVSRANSYVPQKFDDLLHSNFWPKPINNFFTEIFPTQKKGKQSPSHLLSETPNIYEQRWLHHGLKDASGLPHLNTGLSNIFSGATALGVPWIAHEILNGNVKLSLNDDSKIRYFNGLPGSRSATLSFGDHASFSVWLSPPAFRAPGDVTNFLPSSEQKDPSQALPWMAIGRNPVNPTGGSVLFINSPTRFATLAIGSGFRVGGGNYGFRKFREDRFATPFLSMRGNGTFTFKWRDMLSLSAMSGFSLMYGVDVTALAAGPYLIGARVSEYTKGPSAQISWGKLKGEKGFTPVGSYNFAVLPNPTWVPPENRAAKK